jgi:hypothetical protein
MQLGDQLAFAGIVVSFVGIGIALLWPTKRWIGAIAMILGVAAILVWAWLFFTSKPTLGKVAPVISWFPAPLKAGEPLTPAQLNAIATVGGISIPGESIYNPALGSTFTAGGHTLSVTFTPDSPDYLVVSKTLTVQVIGSPVVDIKPSISKGPVVVRSIQVLGERQAGNKVGVRIVLQNLSGGVVGYYGRFFYIMVPTTAGTEDQRAHLEDVYWSRLLKLNKGSLYQIPSLEKYAFGPSFETIPLSELEADSMKEGSSVLYLLAIFQDSQTGNDLVEMCGFIGKDNSLSLCHKHNMP